MSSDGSSNVSETLSPADGISYGGPSGKQRKVRSAPDEGEVGGPPSPLGVILRATLWSLSFWRSQSKASWKVTELVEGEDDLGAPDVMLLAPRATGGGGGRARP